MRLLTCSVRPTSFLTRSWLRQRRLLTIDLRSDTVTRPTEAMLRAAASCPVGDDVYGEDPTVNALEQRIAQMTGHEAAVFCASGTMTNQLGLRSHLTQPPHSVLCDARAHIHLYECGGIAFHSQAATVTVRPSNGRYLTAEEIEASIVDEDQHHAPTRVIALENTLNGMIFPLEEIKRIRQLAQAKRIALHLDGARLWNAAVATGTSLRQYGQLFDSMSLCLSKGMGCPIGSVLVGSEPFIRRARWFRKLFGGGWRQAGLLAAMGLVALDDYPRRMATDHLHARQLGEICLQRGFGLALPVETNMVFLDTRPLDIDANQLANMLAKYDILVMPMDANTIRMVLHHQVQRTDLDRFIDVLDELLHTRPWSNQETPTHSTGVYKL